MPFILYKYTHKAIVLQQDTEFDRRNRWIRNLQEIFKYFTPHSERLSVLVGMPNHARVQIGQAEKPRRKEKEHTKRQRKSS